MGGQDHGEFFASNTRWRVHDSRLAIQNLRIIFLNPAPVMQLMARDHPRERINGNLVLARYSPLGPRLCVQTLEQQDRCVAHRLELFEQILQTPRARSGIANIIILLETRQRILVSTGEAQRAKRKDTLAIDYVPEHFFQAPFAHSVAVIASAIRKIREHYDRLPNLASKLRDDFSIRHKRDVFSLIRRMFVGCRTHTLSLRGLGNF